MLYRGRYRLPHMPQVLHRDEYAETIARHPGVKVHAFMLDEKSWRERRDTGKGGMPYRFLVYHPTSCATNWTAFFTREELDTFCEAYGVKLDREPKPGEPFQLILPDSADAFAPLHDDGKPYDPSEPNPHHAAMYWPRWRASFTGRKLGAIGISQRFTVEVVARDEDAARLKLYDTHEHIHGVTLTRIDTPQ